jgi:hypothetical protein
VMCVERISLMRSSSHNSIARTTNGNRKEQKCDWRRQTGKRLAKKLGGLNDPIIVQVNRIIQECSACVHRKKHSETNESKNRMY